MSEYSQIRAGINNWSLESDDRLFRKIESFAQNFLNKVDALKADVQMTDYAITSNQVEVGNVFSRFNNLSNQKFTENKMQPFNDNDIFRRSNIDSTVIPTQSEPHQNIVERYQQALNIGMDNVNIAQFLNMPDDIDDRLSVSDAGERSYSIYSESSVMPGKNNRLPFIIGTRAFYEDDFVGIYENPDQKPDPASLSYQEISFPDASITIEQNYIPKIDPPPKPEPVQIPAKTDPAANSEQNSSIISPPPPPAVNLGSTNVVVNAGAPPPPPNLLLPGIKPGSMPPPPANNMIPPPMNNIMVPPPMNNMPPPINMQPGPPQVNTNIKVNSGVPPPPPLNLLLQNQQNNKKNNQNNIATQPPINTQTPPMNNNMGDDQKNSNEQKSIPIHLALQQMLAMKNKMQNPTPPQNEEINNSARGSIQQNMGFNPNQNQNQNQNMGFNPMQSNPGFNQNQNQNMGFNPNQNNPGFNQNPNQNMGFNPMQNQQFNNNMPSNMAYMQPNMYNNNPQINNPGFNNPMQNNYNQNPSLSQQNLMDPSMEINMQFPIGFNPMQNYFQPAMYQQNQYNQPQIPIISPPANNKMGLPPQSSYLNDQKSTPPANIPPPNKNITVNQKAPPPPSLKLLIQKAEDEKSKSPSPEKKQHTESKPNPSQFMNPMQNPPLNQQDGNQFSQPPPQNQPQGGMPNFAEALLAQQRKMMNKNKDPNANQQISNQPPPQTQANSQFRESLNALQGKKQDFQPVKEPEPIVEPPPPTVGFNPMALFKSQLEQKMMERGGGSIQPREENKDESQGQDSLLPPRNRPTLNKGNTVSFGEPLHKADENLETLYKPSKLKGAKKSIFENEEGSDNDDPIFNKPKNRDKFENLFKPPVVNLEEKMPAPNTKKQDTPERAEYIEPKSNSNEKFNNKKLEDTTFLVSRDPVLANKDDLLEKPKIKIDNPAKISKLFDDSDDEKKKTDVNELYKNEKLKRSKTTAMPEKKEKYNKLFNDDDDEEEKPKFTPKKSVEPSNKQSSPPIESNDPHIKPILKSKHDEEDNPLTKKKGETKLRAKFDDEEEENQIKQKKEEDDNIFGKKKNDSKIKTKFDDELNEEEDIFGKKLSKKNEEEIKQKQKVVFDETKNMTKVEDKPKVLFDEPKNIPKAEDNLFEISKNTITNESKPLPSLGDPLKTKITAKFEDNEPEEDIFGKKSIKNEEKTKQTILNESKPLPSLGDPIKSKIKSNFDEEPEENIFGKKSLNKSEKQTVLNESKPLPSLGDPIKSKIKANFDEEPEENIFGKKSLETREHDEKPKKTILSESKPLPSLGDPIQSKIKNNFEEPNEAPLFKPKKQESPIKEQQKPVFPPKTSPEKIEKTEPIIENKPKEEDPALNKKPTRTLNAKMMDLQAKLGNLPMGLPNERISMNPRKNQKKDEKVELDNDILLDKPTISRKKKPRGQKAANFENDNDEILQFERKAQPIQPEPQLSEKEIHTPIETSIQIGLERPSETNLKGIDHTSEKKLDRPSEFKTDRPSKKPDLLFEDSQESLFNVRKEVSIIKENSIQKPKLPDIFGDPLVSKSSKPLDRPSERNPLDRPSERNPLEKPSDKNPLGVSGKKTGLFMDSSENIPENKGPSLPSLGDSKPLPVITDEKEDKKKKKHHHKKEKKDIFEDDEEEKVEKKIKEIKPPVIESKPSKSNLPDFKGPGIVPKPGEKQSKKLKKLFDDDDDDGSFLFKPGGR